MKTITFSAEVNPPDQTSKSGRCEIEEESDCAKRKEVAGEQAQKKGRNGAKWEILDHLARNSTHRYWILFSEQPMLGFQ